MLATVITTVAAASLSLKLFLWGTTFRAFVGWLGASVNVATDSADPGGGAIGGSFLGFGSLSFLHVLFLFGFDFKQRFSLPIP